MNQVSLSLLVLKTNNLEACRAFYEGIGISFVREQHDSGPMHYAGSLQGLVLEIYPASKSDSASRNASAGIMLGFEIEGLLETVERLSALTGVPVDFLKHSSQAQFTVVDPDGRKVLLYERKS